jgi:hypothetical protein
VFSEEVNWNPMDWDRAAEDLTWERVSAPSNLYRDLLVNVSLKVSFLLNILLFCHI